MARYFIRAYVSDWKEVTKEKADSFIKSILGNVTTSLTDNKRQEIINYHYRVEKEI